MRRGRGRERSNGSSKPAQTWSLVVAGRHSHSIRAGSAGQRHSVKAGVAGVGGWRGGGEQVG